MAEGVEFPTTPDVYYDRLLERLGELPIPLSELREWGILVDSDTAGILFQIVTTSIGSRLTLFLELIQRLGAEGFGSGNIRAPFEAVERAESAAGGA